MKKIYSSKNLYVAIPSKIDKETDKVKQNLNYVAIVTVNEEKKLVSVIDGEEMKIFNRGLMEKDNKFVGVFKNDIDFLNRYLCKINNDYITDIEGYMKIITNIKLEYELDELKIINDFIKKEIFNLEYPKTAKTKKIKRKKR